jgi:hypothetical protein
VAVSESELRAHTRHPVRVGQGVSCAVGTATGSRTATGHVVRCAVTSISAEGLTYEVLVTLDEPSRSAQRAAAVEAGGAAAPPDAPRDEDQPDLDALFEVIEQWDPSDER